MTRRLGHSELQLLRFLLDHVETGCRTAEEEQDALKRIVSICERALPPPARSAAPNTTAVSPRSPLEVAWAARRHAGDTP